MSSHAKRIRCYRCRALALCAGLGVAVLLGGAHPLYGVRTEVCAVVKSSPADVCDNTGLYYTAPCAALTIRVLPAPQAGEPRSAPECDGMAPQPGVDFPFFVRPPPAP